MGWFGKRAERKAREEQERVEAEEQARKRAEAEAADPNAGLKQQFYAAVARGSLDDASAVLDRYLADNPSDPGPADYEPSMSLLEHAALVRRALTAEQPDEAAEILASWDIKPPNTSTMGPERQAQLPNLNALGMVLIDFFSQPGCESHSRYDDLMDRQLRHVAQWTRLSSPMPQPGGFFDQVYANVKSKRELSRAADP